MLSVSISQCLSMGTLTKTQIYKTSTSSIIVSWQIILKTWEQYILQNEDEMQESSSRCFISTELYNDAFHRIEFEWNALQYITSYHIKVLDECIIAKEISSADWIKLVGRNAIIPRYGSTLSRHWKPNTEYGSAISCCWNIVRAVHRGGDAGFWETALNDGWKGTGEDQKEEASSPQHLHLHQLWLDVSIASTLSGHKCNHIVDY